MPFCSFKKLCSLKINTTHAMEDNSVSERVFKHNSAETENK